MTQDAQLYLNQFKDMFLTSMPLLSDIKPSAWVEKNVMIRDGAFPGPFRYSLTPYTREIIDCLAPDHPARWVAVMKGAQLGFSSGILIPGIGWLIANQPGNTFLTVGAPDLIEKAMEKIDLMIDGAGLRSLIKPSVQRNRANKSGDTNSKKEFPGGYVTVASAGNHKAIRQVDLMYGFFDDFESVKGASKESGDTKALLDQRFAAYANKHKIFYISTPEVKQTSNIEPAYEMGDQRKFMIPCECCRTLIEIKWSVVKDSQVVGGMIWETDEDGLLIPGSVAYKCQECGGTFTDANKSDLLNAGMWVPTAKPKKPGFYSYHISSLMAPPGMYTWEYYVNLWIEAHPKGQPRNDSKYQTFINTCLGETYTPSSESPKANSIQRNTRNYEVGVIPDKLSIKDGNGPIVLVTCAADMNGKEDDARLDYEVVAWAENGAAYSVTHGSIGTFVPRENTLKVKEDREKWSYQDNSVNCVWPEFEKMLATGFEKQSGGEQFIFISALDTGNMSEHAYTFLSKTQMNVIGIKGDKENKNILLGVNVPMFKISPTVKKLYILQVGLYKDRLSNYMQLNWTPGATDQPANFMNYPEPSGGKYGFANFFEHYESEEKTITKNSSGVNHSYMWAKKSTSLQNHMWDCRIYNIAIKDIFIHIIGKETGSKDFTWSDYASLIASGLK